MSLGPAIRPAARFSAAIWSASFRPFFLLVGLYAPLALMLWLPAAPLNGSVVWHGHEMVFGFSVATILGFALTALPTWAGMEPIAGGRLALLAALWAAGRLAVWLVPLLDPALVGIIDCLLLPVAAVLLAPRVFRVENKVFVVILPILLLIALGNVWFHTAVAAGAADQARAGLRFAVLVITVLFGLVGGFLTPVFTAAALAGDERAPTHFDRRIEAAAVITLLLQFITAAALPGSLWSGLAAAAAALAHAVRLLSWRGWRVAAHPVVYGMHLAYGCLVLSFALRAWDDLHGGLPQNSALHAFTVGALGMMKLSLMSRVALRHTGRPLTLRRRVVAAALLLAVVGAGLRLAAGPAYLIAAAALWGAAFLLFLGGFGAFLLRPSRPRG